MVEIEGWTARLLPSRQVSPFLSVSYFKPRNRTYVLVDSSEETYIFWICNSSIFEKKKIVKKCYWQDYVLLIMSMVIGLAFQLAPV